MTTGLDKAREQYEAGRYKAAVETLLYLEPQIRGAEDFDGARALVDIASSIHEQSSGGVRKDCESLIESANAVLLDEVRYSYRSGAIQLQKTFGCPSMS